MSRWGLERNAEDFYLLGHGGEVVLSKSQGSFCLFRHLDGLAGWESGVGLEKSSIRIRIVLYITSA